MERLFEEFKKVSKQEWIDKIVADLKGKPLSILEFDNVIEDIQFTAYYHHEDVVKEEEMPGNFPFKRGYQKKDNQFKNVFYLPIEDEKKSNEKALWALNFGAEHLIFDSQGKQVDWKTVTKEILFAYIEADFILSSQQALDDILSAIPLQDTIHFQVDLHEENWSFDDIPQLIDKLGTSRRIFAVNAHKLQQIGANSWQEIVFALSTGHEYLYQLLKRGYSIDQATKMIGFHFGIGSNYFIETAKIRAFKWLWAKIIRMYNPECQSAYKAHIISYCTYVNKSLKDPYTNLLRQTTEVMSVINGGVDSICVLPFDLYSSKGTKELSQRMALNTVNILKEESFADKVIDPVGGSYSTEKLTEFIAEKAWEKFQEYDDETSLFDEDKRKQFIDEVMKIREERIKKINNKEVELIGINVYFPEKKEENEWTLNEKYLGVEPLILEKEYIAEEA